MASKKKIVELIASIKTIYPYYAKDVEQVSLVNTWYLLLKDYTDKAVDIAMIECLKTCKTPPSPADVIEQLDKLEEIDLPTPEKLWIVLIDALHKTENLISKFDYTFRESNGYTQGENARFKSRDLWNDLPKEIKQYLGGYGELINIAKNYTERDLQFEKIKFINKVSEIRKRQKTVLMLNNSEEKQIENSKPISCLY